MISSFLQVFAHGNKADCMMTKATIKGKFCCQREKLNCENDPLFSDFLLLLSRFMGKVSYNM